MKKRPRKSKIFNSVNIILIALVLIEIAFVVNEGGLTGQPVKVGGDFEIGGVNEVLTDDITGTTESDECNTEVCGRLDENCDGLIDDPFLCQIHINAKQNPKFNGYIIELKDEPVSKIYVEEKNKVDKGLSTKQALNEKTNSHRKNLVDKQNNLETNIKSLYPKARIDSKVQNVFNGFIVSDITEIESKRLESLTEIKKVYKNYEIYTTLMDSVPLINADDVWQLQDSEGRQVTGQGIDIAVIDTGVDYTHSDLGGCFGQGCKVVSGWDFVNNDPDPMDDQGHGTHVAATAAGNGVLKGVAPDATIYAYKVCNSGRGCGYLLEAISLAVDPNQDGDFSDHADVIQMSIGGYGDPDDPLSQAIDNAVDIGVVAVIAAGNAGPYGRSDCRHSEDISGAYYSICSPGTARKAITVAASDKNNIIAGFSSRGPTTLNTVKPDITAPGVSICAAQYDSAWDYARCLDDEHTAISGTSMATPHVSGVVALIKQAHPDWNPEQIKYVLKNTAVDLPGNIFEDGWGRVDTLEAAQTNQSAVSALQLFEAEIFGRVDILGDISSINFLRYSLTYKSAFGNDSSTVIFSSSLLPSSNILMNDWNTLSIDDGLYQLKLTVTDINNKKWADSILVSIANNPKIKIYSGYNTAPSIETYYMGTKAGENVSFKVVATSSGGSEGVCNGCAYQLYKDDVLASTNYEYSTNFDGKVLTEHKIKVLVTDTINGKTSEKSVTVIMGIRQLTKDAFYQWSPSVYKDKIVWSDLRGGNYDIYMYDLSTNTERQITTNPYYQGEPAMYENKIVYSDERNGWSDIYMYDLSTNTETQITTNPSAQQSPEIYGNIIVWDDWRDLLDVSGNYLDGYTQTYMYNLSTNTETQITTNPVNHLAPSIYEDKIVWSERLGTSPWDVYMYDLSTNTKTAITTNPYRQWGWGDAIYENKIVWVDEKYNMSNWDIYMYDLSTNTERPISTNPFDQWSPSIYGDIIVYPDDRNGYQNRDIYMYDLSKNTEAPLANDIVSEDSPAIYGDIIAWVRDTDIWMVNLTEQSYLCADLNSDGVRDIIDVSLLINTAFRNGPEPQPKWIGDLNGDGFIDIIDVTLMINHVFRNGPEPTCTASQTTTSSSGTASLGVVSGTTTKTIPVNLANSEDVAGTTFKISYDATKLGTLKNVRTSTRTNGIDIIRNGNMITLMEQDGSKAISKGSGTVLYLDFTPPKTGFSATSLKITEVKAVNPEAKKIAVSIGKSSVKSGASLS